MTSVCFVRPLKDFQQLPTVCFSIAPSHLDLLANPALLPS
jgi:hypothetical protein